MNDRAPAISLDFSHDRIRIHRATLALLHEPSFLLLMINPDKKTICVQKGGPDDPSAHRVASYRRKHTYYEFCSKSLLSTLLEHGEWDPTKCYRLSGLMIDEDTAIFSFADVNDTPEQTP